MSTDTAGLVCLYTGTGTECWNCGGYTKAIGEDGRPGPFPGDSRYCCEECYAEDQRRQAGAAARARSCPVCGYDNAEHGPGFGCGEPVPFQCAVPAVPR